MRIDTLRACLGVCALALAGCMTLDTFLYAPAPAADNDDLFAAATNIPTALKVEVTTGIVASDGVQVNAWALLHDAANPNDTTFSGRHQTGILYCHGNNQNLGRFALRAQALWQMGYTVLAFDYRGYGKTRGTPSEGGLYRDARAARAYLSASDGMNIDGNRVALYGYSLGAAICGQLAVEAPTQALVLEAPFASVAALVADDSAIQLPQAGFTRAQYDTESKIRSYLGNLLVMHGADDDYLMPAYGQRLFDAADQAAHRTFVLVAGADHETVPCLIKNRLSRQLGGCVGGFDPNYTGWVTTVIDAAIKPKT